MPDEDETDGNRARGEEGMKKRSCGRAIAIAAALLVTACGQGTTAACFSI